MSLQIFQFPKVLFQLPLQGIIPMGSRPKPCRSGAGINMFCSAATMTHLDHYHTSHMRTGVKKTVNVSYVQSVQKVPTYSLQTL